jgi:hypothetical protein
MKDDGNLPEVQKESGYGCSEITERHPMHVGAKLVLSGRSPNYYPLLH